MSKATDSASKDFKLDGSGMMQPQNVGAFAAGQPGVMNSSSIEQHFAFKYKDYSMVSGQSNTGNNPPTAQKMPPTMTPQSNTSGMLPNSSQYLYAGANLRGSLEKPQLVSDGGALSMSDLPITGQSLGGPGQHPQQFLNMNASMGSQQNQNLGPTQIFYQGVPLQHQTTSSSNSLPFSSGNQNQSQQFKGLDSSGVGTNASSAASGQNNLLQQTALSQLMSQMQTPSATPGQQQQQQPQQQNIFGNNATQFLLLELLRQNNLQQQLTMVQSQDNFGPSTANSSNNPTNQSMYGTGFATATQLLAQSQQQSTSETAVQQVNSVSKDGSSNQNASQMLGQQQQRGQPGGTDAGYSNNLHQIYQKLNNYSTIIDNLESGAPPSTANRNQNQFDVLSQSNYQAQPTPQQQSVQIKQHQNRNASIELLNQQQPPKSATCQITQQNKENNNTLVSFVQQQQPPHPSFAKYDRERDSEYQLDRDRDHSPTGGTGSPPYRAATGGGQQQPMMHSDLSIGQRVSSSQEGRNEGQQHQRSRGVRDYEFGGRHDQILEERGESGERSMDQLNNMSRDNEREEDDTIMWPSASYANPRKQEPAPYQLHHQKSTSGDGTRQNINQEPSMSGVDWAAGRGATRQSAKRRGGMHGASVEEVEEHSSNFNMQTDFNYREDHSGSGFERDIHNQGSSGDQLAARNHWMRDSSRSGIDIDEIPIPTTDGGPKTFEELLAEKMEAEAALGRQEQEKEEARVPKKQFLKRKKPTYVPPPKPPTKQYKYYSDAIAKQNDGNSVNFDDQQEARNSRRQHVPQQQTSDERRDRRRVHTPNAVVQQTSGRQNSEAGGRRDIMPNQGAEIDSGPRQRNTSAIPQHSSQTPTNAVAKPFLKRGTGTAHLQGRLRNAANPGSSNNLHKQQNQTQQQQEPKPLTPKIDKRQKSPSVDVTDKQRNKPLNNNPYGGARGSNPLEDFKKLEQDCNNREDYKINMQQPPRQQQRKKKLFDSDSDGDEHELQQEHKPDEYPKQLNNNTMNRNQSPPNVPSRSNIVKKMFYKDDGGSAVQQSTGKNRHPAASEMEDDEAKPYMNPQMEALFSKRQEQLEKAISRYNADNEALSRQKTQYDSLLRKVKAEQRELEAQRKRASEDVDRLKEEEMIKLRKEKRALEQRQKNFNLVSNTAKKEREEIDFLRRDFNKYKADAELKAKKQQSQIERLTKQNNELKQKNKELTEDLRAMEQQRIILERGGSGPSSVGCGLNQSIHQGASRTSNSQQSRYSFTQNNNKRGSGVGSGSGSATYGRSQTTTSQMDMKNQLLFQDEGTNDTADTGFNNNNNQLDQQESKLGRRQFNEEEEEEDEEELQAEEADQVYDNFVGMPSSQAVRGAVGNKKGVTLGMVDEDDGSGEEADDDQKLAGQVNQLGAAGQGAAASDEEEDFSLRFPKEYHSKTLQNQKVVEQYVGHDGKIQRIYQNGKKEVIFNNGVKRESFPDGYTIVYFNNQDIKQTFPDGKVVYYFAEAQTTQTTFPDKLQVFKFSNNQIEKHFPDKTKEIIFPDGTIKCIFEDGEEESIFPDGTIQKIEKSGVKAIEFANGQKDILYPDGIRVREFPDGKVRKTYPDGRTEVFQR